MEIAGGQVLAALVVVAILAAALWQSYARVEARLGKIVALLGGAPEKPPKNAPKARAKDDFDA